MYLSRARRTAIRTAGCLILAFAASQLLATPIITTVAGHGAARYAADGGPASQASFDLPTATAIAPDGTLYVYEQGARLIRRIDPKGTISTYAGNGFWERGGNHVPATQAGLGLVVGMAADGHGNLYLTEQGYQLVRKIGADGMISDVAGNGAAGYTGDNGPATSASLNTPTSLATDAAGNVYIADTGNGVVRVLAPGGTLSTLGGTGKRFAVKPDLVSVDPAGNIFLLESDNDTLQIVDSSGKQTLSAPSITGTCSGYDLETHTPQLYPATSLGVDANDNIYLQCGWLAAISMNGSRIGVQAAGVVAPMGVDALGNVYYAYWTVSANLTAVAGVIERWSPGQGAVTYAGNGKPAYAGDGGQAHDARLAAPALIAFAPNGDYFVYDATAYVIRKVAANGMISTVAGNGVNSNTGDGGPAPAAGGITAQTLAADGAGNVYFSTGVAVRKVAANGTISTVAGNGLAYSGASGDGTPATQAAFSRIQGLAADGAGNVYIGDGSRIYRMTPDGLLHTVAGKGDGTSVGDGGPAIQATINENGGLAIGADGNLYFVDMQSMDQQYVATNSLRKVDAKGMISTVPGSTSQNFSPTSFAVDTDGSIYWSDSGLVDRLSPNGTLSQLAGGSSPGFSGDFGPAASAALGSTYLGLALDGKGGLYVADGDNQAIRRISLNPPMAATVATTGDDHHLSLKASLQFNGAAAGTTDNVYVCAKLPDGRMFFQSATGWVPFDYRTAPALQSGVTLGGNKLTVLDGSMDVSGLVGTVIYVGYGSNTGDLFSTDHYQLVYTIQ